MNKNACENNGKLNGKAGSEQNSGKAQSVNSVFLGQAEDGQQNKLVFEKLPGDQRAGHEMRSPGAEALLRERRGEPRQGAERAEQIRRVSVTIDSVGLAIFN